MKKKYLRIGYSILALVIAYFALNQLLQMTVAKTIGIGELIWWGGALMAFAGFMALKPHLKKKL